MREKEDGVDERDCFALGHRLCSYVKSRYGYVMSEMLSFGKHPSAEERKKEMTLILSLS